MSLMKKAIGGSIHRIREFELEKVNLIDEFDILQIVGEGWFGKILLTEHRSTQTEMVLKALPKAYIGITDFFREFHYGLHLAAHRNIITTYDVAFETAGFYVFSQEYAPLGDLTSNVTETGLGELHAKRVARQLAAAVHHIHSRELVHRDIKLDNILVFRSDFSRIKLCDFGETRRVNSVVRRHNEWLPYSPPEVLQINTDETYKALTSHDVWQFGIVLFVCLTGCLPWQKAALDDPRYLRYQNWHNATLNIAKKPKLFQLISSRAQRLFKRLLDPKPEKRPVSVLEVNKYLEDRWLAKLGAEKALNGGADDMDELCPSMYSFHSSVEEKNQLLHTLTTYGIETTVDRTKKKDRIREWIQSSAIAEENEEDESDELNECVKNELQETEDEEPISMRGRHFPEMRPPRTEGTDTRRRKKRADTIVRRRQSTKPIERKIPFAPQVAEERETVARFASFPNGDPTLAIVKNGTDEQTNGFPKSPINVANSTGTITKMDSVADDTSSSTNTNDRAFDDFLTDNGSNSRDNSAPTRSDGSQSTITDSERAAVPLNGTANGSVQMKSPQVPSRRHRAQTSSPALNGNRERPTTKRSQSVNASIPMTTEKSPLPVTKTNRSPPLESSFVVVPYKPQSPRHSQSMSPDVQSNDVVKNSNEVAPMSLNKSDIQRNSVKEKSNDVSQVLTINAPMMSATSHLAIRSFNTLQSISNSSSPPPQSSSSSSIPKSVPSSSKTKQQHRDETNIFVYGKDAYEHYGIAQGAIIKTEGPVVKRSSISGSASRSVSN